MNQMLEQMICSKENTKSVAEETLQAELTQLKSDFEKTKAEEESLRKRIDEIKQELDQERQVHGETNRNLKELQVSVVICIRISCMKLISDFYLTRHLGISLFCGMRKCVSVQGQRKAKHMHTLQFLQCSPVSDVI